MFRKAVSADCCPTEVTKKQSVLLLCTSLFLHPLLLLFWAVPWVDKLFGSLGHNGAHISGYRLRLQTCTVCRGLSSSSEFSLEASLVPVTFLLSEHSAKTSLQTRASKLMLGISP